MVMMMMRMMRMKYDDWDGCGYQDDGEMVVRYLPAICKDNICPCIILYNLICCRLMMVVYSQPKLDTLHCKAARNGVISMWAGT